MMVVCLRMAIATLGGFLAACVVHCLGPSPRVQLVGEVLSPSLFSPDGRWLVVEEWTRAGERKQNLVVNTKTGEYRLRFPGRRLHSLAFSSGGRLLAGAVDYTDADNGIEVWDLETSSEVERLCWRVLPENLNSNLSAVTLAFSPDGKLLLAFTYLLSLWDVEDRKRLADFEPLTPAGPMPARLNSLDLIGYLDEGKRVRLVSMKTCAVVSEFRLPADLRRYRWSVGGRFLAADFYDQSGIQVGDSRTGAWYPINEDHDIGQIESVAEGRPLLAVSAEVQLVPIRLGWLFKNSPRYSAIRLFDISTGLLVDEVPGVRPLLSPDGTTLAMQTRNGALELWDLPRATPWLRSLGTCLSVAVVILLGQLFLARLKKG